jgi:flagellar biogenesis protein FliO
MTCTGEIFEAVAAVVMALGFFGFLAFLVTRIGREDQ